LRENLLHVPRENGDEEEESIFVPKTALAYAVQWN
jgi:hypothetical protein